MAENAQNTVAAVETEVKATAVVNTGVTKSVNRLPLEVSRVYKSDWQKAGSLTAELKQKQITTSRYPSKRVDNNMQDNIFNTKDFGYEDNVYKNERTLVAWIDVPADSTEESVMEKLKAFKDACIYRVISNQPILHNGQVAQINRLMSEGKAEEAIALKNSIADRQVIIYGQDTNDGLHKAGELILDNYGKPQYKADYFSTIDRKDIDDRNSDPESFYVTPTIKEKLSEKGVGSHPDQSI